MIPASGEYRQISRDGCDRGFSYDLARLPNLAAMIRKDPCAPGTMHAACFVAFLAMRFGVAALDETLGDYGLVHELAHIRHIGPDSTPCAASVGDLAVMADDIIARLQEAAERDDK